MIRKLALLGACSALALTIGGCGSDSSPAAAAPAVALSGTAATGAPIAGAALVIRCTGGSDINLTTGTDGGYSVTVPDMTAAGAIMPCALQITLPDLSYLYSLAEANGTANITPLTNLAVAQAINAAAGVAPEAWFAAGDSAALTFPTPEQVAAGRTAVETALQGATGETTVPFDIFTTSFDAGSTDAYDVWLDEFNAALAANSMSYGDLMAGFVSGGTFGAITIDVSPTTGAEGTMVLTVSVNGVAGLPTTVNGVPNPGAQSEFCGGSYQDYFNQSVTSLTIDSCTFSGNTGTINATAHITAPVVMNIPYVVTYVWQ